jgi:hypothetical protein
MQIGVIRLIQFSDGCSYLMNDAFGYGTAITHGFATNQVNMVKLESYIRGGAQGTAQFFMTFEGFNPVLEFFL